jgi:hypothetical protein
MDPSRTSRKKKSPRPKTKKSQHAPSASSTHTQSHSQQQPSAQHHQQQPEEAVTGSPTVNIGGAQVHVVSKEGDQYENQPQTETEEKAPVDMTVSASEEGSTYAKQVEADQGKTKSSEAEGKKESNFNEMVVVEASQGETVQDTNVDEESTETFSLVTSSRQMEDSNVTSPDEGLEISRTVTIATTPCEENLRTVVDIHRGFENITTREDAERKPIAGSLAQIPEDLASSTQSIPDEVCNILVP